MDLISTEEVIESLPFLAVLHWRLAWVFRLPTCPKVHLDHLDHTSRPLCFDDFAPRSSNGLSSWRCGPLVFGPWAFFDHSLHYRVPDIGVEPQTDDHFHDAFKDLALPNG